MSINDGTLTANDTYARSYNLEHLPMPHARGLAVNGTGVPSQ